MPFINDPRQLSTSWRYGPVEGEYGEFDPYTRQILYSTGRPLDENDFFISLSLGVDLIGSQRYQWWKRQTWREKLQEIGAEALRQEEHDYLQQPWWRQLLKRTFTDITKKQRLLAYNELYNFKINYKNEFFDRDRNDQQQRAEARQQALRVINNFQQRNPYDSDSNILNYHQLNDHQKISFDGVTKKISKEKVRLRKILYPDTPSSTGRGRQFSRPASSYPQPQATKSPQKAKAAAGSLKNFILKWSKQTAQLLGFFNLYQAQNQARQPAPQGSRAVNSNSSGGNQAELERENRRLKVENEQLKAEKERLEDENERLKTHNESLEKQHEKLSVQTAVIACNIENSHSSQSSTEPTSSPRQTHSSINSSGTAQPTRRRFSVSQSDLWCKPQDTTSEEKRERSLSL